MHICHWDKLSDLEKQQTLARPAITSSDSMRQSIARIIAHIRSDGDAALLALTEQYDQVALTALTVSVAEWAEAKEKITASELSAIEFALARIEAYHNQQLPKAQAIETIDGVHCERQSRPIQRVGLYIPGGSAPLVSTVLMLGIPARLANCPLRILCTPPNKSGKIDPRILITAELCGIKQVFKAGGAQAIAAMAYGTQSIPKVDKIFGPGNAWVTQAKILVAQDVHGASIDMPAGPSELMVIADDSANPNFVAADLLSQAEHGTDSQVLLVAISEILAAQVIAAIQQQLPVLARKHIAEQSLQHCRLIVVDDVAKAIAISNDYAPEHLILQVQKAKSYVAQIQHAGAVFLGHWTPETVGDYVTGSNHVLPTSGYARSWSGLAVTDFMKFISVQHVTQQGLQNIGSYAEGLAEMEGLGAHKNAVAVRLKHGIPSPLVGEGAH